MKTLILFSTLLTTTLAFARPIPLLSYQSHSGFTRPENRKSVSCTIFQDKVVKNINLAGKETSTTSQVAFTAEVKNVDAVIKLSTAAKKGKIKNGAMPMDAPMETFSIVQILPTDGTKEIMIRYGIRNMGYPVKENTSKAAKTLVKFINFNCNQQN